MKPWYRMIGAFMFAPALLLFAGEVAAAEAQKAAPPAAPPAGAKPPAATGTPKGPMVAIKLECIIPEAAKKGLGGMSKNPFGYGGPKVDRSFFAKNGSPNPLPAGMVIRWALKGKQTFGDTGKWSAYEEKGEFLMKRPLEPGHQVKFLDFPHDMAVRKVESCETVAGLSSGPAGGR